MTEFAPLAPESQQIRKSTLSFLISVGVLGCFRMIEAIEGADALEADLNDRRRGAFPRQLQIRRVDGIQPGRAKEKTGQGVGGSH
jgi:hypothetical protein